MSTEGKGRLRGARRGSAEWKRRVGEGVRSAAGKRREASSVRPRDLDRLRQEGRAAESLRPLLGIAEAEAAELIAALGGPETLSPQRRALVEDLVAVGIVLRGELARFLQTGDGEAGARVGSLANSRRASLAALGLDERRVELDLQTYLERHEATARAPKEVEHALSEGQRAPRAPGTAEEK